MVYIFTAQDIMILILTGGSSLTVLYLINIIQPISIGIPTFATTPLISLTHRAINPVTLMTTMVVVGYPELYKE